MRAAVVRGLVILHAWLGLVGCAPATPDGAVLSLPRALVACAQPPANLAARMWVSGKDEPCPLDVDLAAGTTSGNCDVIPGRERVITVDWLVPEDSAPEIVLAQAQQKIDLREAADADVDVTLANDDVRTADCRDMRDDQLDGAPTVTVGEREVPVCDLDDSCAGSANPADPACSNLGELCAGHDPLVDEAGP